MIRGLRVLFERRCLERGYTFEHARPCIIAEDGDWITVDEYHKSYPRPIGHERRAAAPGTALKAILHDWLGIEAADCGCNDMAARMDLMGPQWCRSHGMPVILNSMRREHQKRRAAGTTSLPWSEFAARRLVLLACRLAESLAVY